MVKVTPLTTVTDPLNTMGDCCFVQVVFAVIKPETSVDARTFAMGKAATNIPARRRTTIKLLHPWAFIEVASEFSRALKNIRVCCCNVAILGYFVLSFVFLRNSVFLFASANAYKHRNLSTS
jgi:hypothetical protein